MASPPGASDASPPPVDPCDQIVTVNVGKRKTKMNTYRIHKKLITSTSTYFASVFNNGFEESQKQEVELVDEEDICAFPLFAKWLYSGSFDTAPAQGDREEAYKTIMKFCKIFVFADKRGIATLQKLAIDATVQQLGNSWYGLSQPIVKYVYQNTLESSVLRKVISGFCAWCHGNAFFQTELKEWAAIGDDAFDFLRDILMYMAGRAKTHRRLSRDEWKALSCKDFEVDEKSEGAKSEVSAKRQRIS